MLVLTRQREEEICIGDNIVIKVLRINGDKVRIGVSAPEGVPVHRREVFEAIQKQKGEAS